MKKEEILTRIEQIAQEHLERPGRLHPNLRLVEDLELDSLLLLTLAIEVENSFSVCLDQEDEAAIHTVGDLVAVVHRKLNQTATEARQT